MKSIGKLSGRLNEAGVTGGEAMVTSVYRVPQGFFSLEFLCSPLPWFVRSRKLEAGRVETAIDTKYRLAGPAKPSGQFSF